MLRLATICFFLCGLGSLRAAPSDFASAADLSRAVAAGTLTSEQIVAQCLARIQQSEPAVNAIITLNPHALDEARALDVERRQSGPRSPLHGIPVLVKDNIDTRDLPTSLGFFGLKGSVPWADAEVIARLRAAGAIILAKTNLSELASGPTFSSAGGQTRNPRNLAYSAAGSSSGTAAGLAAGYAPLGVGSDTTGSIRWPAATTGVVGFKPTTGLLSCAGVLPTEPTLDTVGPLARTVADVAVLFAVLRGPVSAAPLPVLTSLRGVRLGFPRRDLTGNDPVVDTVVLAAVARLQAAGATIVDVELPFALTELPALTDPIYRAESLPAIDGYLAALRPGWPHSLADILAQSERVTGPSAACPFPNPGRLQGYRDQLAALPLTDPGYLAARDQGRARLRAGLQALIDRSHLDALIYPTSNQRINAIGTPAHRGLKGYYGNLSCSLASLTGWPDLTLPAGATPEGLPVGLSLSSPAWTDDRLLALGAQVERDFLAR